MRKGYWIPAVKFPVFLRVLTLLLYAFDLIKKITIQYFAVALNSY